MIDIHKKIKKFAKPMLYASILTMAVGIGSASSAKEKQLPEKNYFTDWGIVDKLGYSGNGHYVKLGDLDGDGDLDIIVITGTDSWDASSLIKIYENRIPQKNK